MSNLMQANRQWSTRPADERFLSLPDMLQHFQAQRLASTEKVVSTRRIEAVPDADNGGLSIVTDNGEHSPTHHAFNQLAAHAEAPSRYLRTLPSPIAADCINYGLRFRRGIDDIGLLLYENGSPILRAATGPKYGRIWNNDVVKALIERFGDGINGAFRVPGEFGVAVPVTKGNTTLYAGDRDMFVFLADEAHRIEIPNRRHGEPGTLARGFFMWNSEVGAGTLGVATFLFDYACQNRIVWGAKEYQELTIRHTASAPDKFIEEVAPALESYAQSSTMSITRAVEAARKAHIDNVDEFLRKRFSRNISAAISMTHMSEEGRPIETLWDAATGITAYARGVEYQDDRVVLEREAGKLLDIAA